MLATQRCKGNVQGKNIQDFIKQLDFSLNQQERVELVNKLVYTQGDGMFVDEFFEDMFEQKDAENGMDKSHIKLCLNSKDMLSMDDYTCKGLETIANYILFSPDGERINKKTKYNFYPKDIFEKKSAKEVSLEGFTESNCGNEIYYEEVIDFLIREGINYKKSIKQTIYGKDKSDLDVIKQYDDVINTLSVIMKDKDISSSTKKKIGMIMYGLKDDQLLCKDMLKGTIYFKQAMGDSTEIDYEQFDFSDKEQIIALLKVPTSTNFDSDLACLTYDLNNIIKKIQLTHSEKVVLNLWKNKDSTANKIAEYLNVSQPYITKTLNGIAKKISEQWWEDYENWYYLNIVKGSYKKCCRCNEVKLTNKFGKDSRNKDKLKNYCRKCDKKR